MASITIDGIRLMLDGAQIGLWHRGLGGAPVVTFNDDFHKAYNLGTHRTRDIARGILRGFYPESNEAWVSEKYNSCAIKLPDAAVKNILEFEKAKSHQDLMEQDYHITVKAFVDTFVTDIESRQLKISRYVFDQAAPSQPETKVSAVPNEQPVVGG